MTDEKDPHIENAAPEPPPAPPCYDCEKPTAQPIIVWRDQVGEGRLCETCAFARAANGVVQVPQREVHIVTPKALR